ncbi:hypothetical protein EV401DRAFT_2207616 [Pisolithus croceorrhizus]|nr:hypothetical protein EV401DRAFT_2207616 [Pisolithus croceorrhizus]
MRKQAFQSISLCASRNGRLHKPSSSAPSTSHQIWAESHDNPNPLTAAAGTAQSQPTKVSPWSAAPFNFLSSILPPFPVNEGGPTPNTLQPRPLGRAEGSFSSTASSHSVISHGVSGPPASDGEARQPLSSIQPSLPSIPENISSSPMFPWSQNPFTNGPPGQQQLGSNLPVVPSQQGVNPYSNVTPTTMFWADPRVPHNMPQLIHVRLQTPLGDSHMQSGPQYPPYHEVTEGGSVSKKRKTSASRKGVARANLARADSETSERTSITETAPSQVRHPFPDWPITDYAGIPASRNTSLDPSGPSVAAGPAGSGTSVSGGPANFSFTPFLKFFTESVNHLVSTFESNQLSVQHTMKEQQQQFSSHLELLHAKIAQTSPAAPSGQPTPSSFLGDAEGGDDLPIPPKKKWTKCRFLKNSQAVDGEVDMATYDQFLQYTHDHLLALLGIRDLKNIADAKDRCRISEEENEAFIRELPGCIQITANDFRLDLSRDCSTLFNRTAMEIFAADFYQKVTLDNWYNSLPIPARYLQVDIINDCFYYHLKHVKSRYKHFVIDMALNSEAARAKEDKRLQKVSRGVRKVRLYKWRLNAIAEDPHLSRHKCLLEALGTQGMSSDESDTEVPGSSRPTTYPRIYPKWCSQQLSAFLWKIDVIVEKIHASPVGRCKRGGNPLRIRPHSKWLDSLPVRSKAALKAKDVDYKFSDADGTFAPMTE